MTRFRTFCDPYSVPKEDGPPTMALRFCGYIRELAGIALGLTWIVALVGVVVGVVR